MTRTLALVAAAIALIPALPNPSGARELYRATKVDCYSRQPDQEYKKFSCELRLIFNDSDPYADAIQVKWDYGGLSEFTWKAGQWTWFEPNSKKWISVSPKWVVMDQDRACIQFGAICFGRGFPVNDFRPTGDQIVTMPGATPNLTPEAVKGSATNQPGTQSSPKAETNTKPATQVTSPEAKPKPSSSSPTSETKPKTAR
jgi:hypothetical protein